MDAELLKDLIVNAAMMSVLSALLTFGYNRIHKGRKLTLVVLGLSIGAAGYLIMLQGAAFDSLHILDANMVLIGAAGMFLRSAANADRLALFNSVRTLTAERACCGSWG